MLLEIYFTFDKNPTEHSLFCFDGIFTDISSQNFIAMPTATTAIGQWY